jgi:hypothetical protein
LRVATILFHMVKLFYHFLLMLSSRPILIKTTFTRWWYLWIFRSFILYVIWP